MEKEEKDIFQQVLDKTWLLIQDYEKELENRQVTPEEGYKEPNIEKVQPVTPKS